MSLFHAVVWLDHHSAQVLQFDADQVQMQTVKSHTHPTRQHGNEVRDQHEFYAQVCAALADIREVLVTGGNISLADFKHYADKHQPALAAGIFGYEPVDHPSDKQLVALARSYFVKADRMAGLPTLTAT
jgi:stalled ribosome rescue protein Dom34